MRLATTLAIVVAALSLAGCGGGAPPAGPAGGTPASSGPAEPEPATPTAPATAANLPVGAQPLLGTWSADLAACGNAQAVTVITASSLVSPARTCVIALADNKDGSFSTTCGPDKLQLTPIFAPTGEGINLVVGAGDRQTLLRCGRK